MAKKVQRCQPILTKWVLLLNMYITLGFMLNVSDPFNYSARWLLSSRLILDDPRRTYALTLLLVQMHWRNKYFHICICMDVSHYHVLAKGKLDFKVFSCSSIQFKAFWIPTGPCCSRCLQLHPQLFKNIEFFPWFS